MNDSNERCNAQTRSGTACKRHPAPGRRRCRLHGGCATGPTGGHGLYRQPTDAELASVSSDVDLGQEIKLARVMLSRAWGMWRDPTRPIEETLTDAPVLDLESWFSVTDRCLGRIARLAEVQIKIAELEKLAERLDELEQCLAERLEPGS